MRLYNTLTRQKEELQPLHGKAMGMYACGPTVYDFAHIGNLRTYIFADVLRRTLLYNGYRVTHVMNITDVGHLTEDEREEDKIEARARKEKKSAREIARMYEKVFLDDLKKLNILRPTIVARATAHIKEQIVLIHVLEQKGYTYRIADGIYFDTSKLSSYGKLSGQSLKEKRAGARVAPSHEKRNPEDFALWKFSPRDVKRSMEWDSPWGKGFPGWHIECSAMSVKYLGQPFDIHTGGVDHIGTHHTNEIAQTEAATGRSLAQVWAHGEFLMVEGKRMGKSEGNLITVAQLEDKGFHPLAFRYLVLGAHYRSLLNFTWQSMESAAHALQNIYEKIRQWDKPRIGCAEYEERFYAAVNDDLDIPRALAITHELIANEQYPTSARAKTLLKFDSILGLNISKFLGKPLKIPKEVHRLVHEREKVRAAKDWERADVLRAQIEKLGFGVEDKVGGSKIYKR